MNEIICTQLDCDRTYTKDELWHSFKRHAQIQLQVRFLGMDRDVQADIISKFEENMAECIELENGKYLKPLEPYWIPRSIFKRIPKEAMDLFAESFGGRLG